MEESDNDGVILDFTNGEEKLCEVKLTKDQYEHLQSEADAEGLSLNDLVCKILRDGCSCK